jgi:hypothetical protein
MTSASLDMTDLKVVARYQAAELEAPISIDLPPQAKEKIAAYMQHASARELRTLKFNIDLSKVMEPLGRNKVMRYNRKTGCLEVVSLLTEEDAFPEPAAFSRSSAVIVWRQQQAGGPVEVVLVKERNADRVSFVAGGHKPHENSIAGSIREVEEEVGLKLDYSTLK